MVHRTPVDKSVDLDVLAKGTPGFSGADLANLVNEAALMAARKNRRMVTMRDFEDAKDKVMMGAERRSMAMSDAEKKLTAYHEAGHAIVSINEDASDPIHKATIIPRGRALGMVMRLPESDKLSYKREKMYADLYVAMGGRVAEEISRDIRLSDEALSAILTRYGTRQASELILCCSYFNMLSRFLESTRVALDEDLDTLHEQA